jgi:hypothetical protein
VTLDEFLDIDLKEAIANEALAWIKGLRLARIGVGSLRDSFHHRGDSLWWFTELYLHKEARIASWLTTIRGLERALDALAPDRVMVERGRGEDRYLVATVCAARGIAVDQADPRPAGRGERLRLESRARFYTWTAHWSRRWRGRLPPVGGSHGVVAFVHSAFWKRSAGVAAGDNVPRALPTNGDEGYIGSLLAALRAGAGGATLSLVGVGPRVNFRARPWWHGLSLAVRPDDIPFAPVEAFADASAIRPSLALWRQRAQNERRLVASADLRDRARVAGFDAWPLVARELRGVVRLQWPWSARAMDEAGAVLDRLEPAAVVTYAEAGGWGRAIVLEARRRGVPTVGAQHGFIYRHWLNYLHETDEMRPSPVVGTDRGYPYPTRTLLFDRYAEEHLRAHGHFPADALVVTGSPQRDALVAAIERLSPAARESVRRAIGAAPADAVVLVAAKYTQMRGAFRALAEVAETLPGVRLVVKCHPAETSRPYEEAATGLTRVTVVPASTDLAGLLAIARGVVTVNSTVAVDGLVAGLPAVVVNLPNNLSPFVDMDVMIGARDATEMAAALAALAAGGSSIDALRERGAAFCRRYGLRGDGASVERACQVVQTLAGARGEST